LGDCLIELAENHRSIRSFQKEPVPESDLELIVEAARRAPTAWNLMPISIIAVTDEELRKKIADAVGNQEHVAKAPLNLVFSVDYAKLREAYRQARSTELKPKLSHFLPALIDLGIMSGWAALAAESLGYGVCFVALYINPCAVSEILDLPKHVVPMVDILIGKPAEAPHKRPRHPMKAILSVNSYDPEPMVRGKDILPVYEAWLSTFLEVIGPNGYMDEALRRTFDCLKIKGFDTSMQE